MKALQLFITLVLMISVTSAYSEPKPQAEIKGQGGTGLTINGIRNFTFDANTIIKEDGAVIPAIRGQGGTGFKLRYRVANDANADLTAGTLEEINLINTHKGPVTSLDPFRIFNVDALITADTFFDDNLSFADINVGDELKISGFIDSNSSLLVSRVEADNDPLTEWKLSGFVAGLTASSFQIQNQEVLIGSVVPDNCVSGLQNGEFVEIKATPDMAFTTGSALATVTDIECQEPGIITDPGTLLPVALEGLVDMEDIDLNSRFSIAGQLINVDGMTQYINGEVDDIVVGAKVEVEGLLNTTTSEITANKVKFKEVRFKFEEPVLPADVIPGESIQLFGQIILNTPQLRDEDGIMNNGLNSETQVEVRGYRDRDGNLFATRVRERGNPDPSDVGVDGQIIEFISNGLIVSGVTVDTSGSVFLDQSGTPISAAQFDAMVAVGTEVEVEGTVSNDIVSAVITQIDEDDDVGSAVESSRGNVGGQGIGTITGVDLIFRDSFEQ